MNIDMNKAAQIFADAIQQSRREGWEQGKREAKVLSFSCSCHKAIAKMEYKGESK